uniref:Uncharacterized protein n=1 Tax=Nelumbo nucifera TaxID=4432 RepID=A0A822Y1M6_NELNU|nr:TPA_asm: hypothetical protein HUJ06_027351 [Nelumbo nucifera]
MTNFHRRSNYYEGIRDMEGNLLSLEEVQMAFRKMAEAIGGQRSHFTQSRIQDITNLEIQAVPLPTLTQAHIIKRGGLECCKKHEITFSSLCINSQWLQDIGSSMS